MQEGVRLKYVMCVMLCYVMCYGIKILGKKELVTTNN